MLKRIFVLAFIAAVILVSGFSPVFASLNFSSLKCDMVVESAQMGRSSGKLFMKGDKSRIELKASGMDTITITNDQNAYMYMPGQNVAMKMALSQAKSQVPDVEDYKKSCEYMGEEQIDGKPCGIYKCAKGGGATTVWVSQDFEFPLKVSGSGTTTYYKNIETNVPLDDELFILPQGVQYQDMSNLMEGFKGLLNQSGD